MAKKDFQVQLSTKISIPTWQALDEYAKSSGQSKASIVEKALDQYLEGVEKNERDN
jgi:predicted DNA-binding protein